MKVIGIDVGFAITGWSIILKNPMSKNGAELIDYGSIETDSKLDFSVRLLELYTSLSKVIDEYSPTHMAVESLFFFKNQTTVMNVANARGVILLVGQMKGLQIFDYTPLQVKSSITGFGRAEKKQVQNMVKAIFGLKEIPKPDDIADAIAIGYCHINSYREKK